LPLVRIRVTTVQHGTFDKPYEAADGLACVIQSPFHLTEADYLVLRGRPGQLSTWASGLLAGSAGQAISLAVKWLATLVKNEEFTAPKTELGVLGLTLAIGMLLVAINFLVDERRALMKKVGDHFKENRPALGTVHRDE
jgi:hypothetical protein